VRGKLFKKAVAVAALVGALSVASGTVGSEPAAARVRKPATTTTTAAPTTTSTTAPTNTNTVTFGAVGNDLSAISAFESHAGKKVSLVGSYRSFYWDTHFPTSDANAVYAHGATPMITWEPWNPSNGVNQPAYALKNVAAGNFDAMLKTWAAEVKSFGHPVWIRFAHEMNGNWYPWAVGVNGNTAADYIAAYRHVHDVFVNAGVTNVKWVWNVNTDAGTGVSPSSVYPGSAYVDWMGIDGYNWGTSQAWSTWLSPSQVFGQMVTQLHNLASTKPILLGEMASTETGGNKAQWISDFFTWMKGNAYVKGFVWFDIAKETDWRIESSSSAQTAFATAVADPRYA
jgi:beta-mannanase